MYELQGVSLNKKDWNTYCNFKPSCSPTASLNTIYLNFDECKNKKKLMEDFRYWGLTMAQRKEGMKIKIYISLLKDTPNQIWKINRYVPRVNFKLY
jgi:hypothetical protein